MRYFKGTTYIVTDLVVKMYLKELQTTAHLITARVANC